MKIKQVFIWSSIFIGVVALILVGLLVFGGKTLSCNTGDSYDKQSNVCYFTNTTCPPTMQSTQVTNSTESEPLYNCIYNAKSIFDNKTFLFIIILIGIGWLIIFVIFLVSVFRQSGGDDKLGEFRKEDKVDADRARHLWAVTFAREHNISMNGEENYEKKAFNFYNAQQIFQKGQEWFVQFQCDVSAGRNPGLYTVILSLSRGEKWILGGNQNWMECSYHNYKFSRTKPLHTPQNLNERMIQQLAETNPEKAMALQEKMIEEGASKMPTTEQVAPDVASIDPYGGMGGAYPPYRPRSRRPFYRRY